MPVASVVWRQTTCSMVNFSELCKNREEDSAYSLGVRYVLLAVMQSFAAYEKKKTVDFNEMKDFL